MRSKSLLVAASAIALSALSFAARTQTDHKYHFALVGKDGHMIVDWSGSDENFQKGNTDRLYVEKDGKRFVITDAGTIRQVRAAYAPVTKIANEQAALGERQARLGDEQAKIGQKQAALGEKMGTLGGRLGDLSARNDPGSDAKAKSIHAQMDELEKQMHELDKQMNGPSSKQKELGKQQEELGKQEKEADAKATIKVDAILDSAFARGLARPA